MNDVRDQRALSKSSCAARLPATCHVMSQRCESGMELMAEDVEAACRRVAVGGARRQLRIRKETKTSHKFT
ncbi:unnamed protein product [Leptidea sinapis]|uniref:Uncharacterized protein n=1 Tax=Leptidea sinapis TaxID=189913 RepID=A0A5E4QKR6_9NEOP|nr:unnamed protein product [Leptidea sinapis]